MNAQRKATEDAIAAYRQACVDLALAVTGTDPDVLPGHLRRHRDTVAAAFNRLVKVQEPTL